MGRYLKRAACMAAQDNRHIELAMHFLCMGMKALNSSPLPLDSDVQPALHWWLDYHHRDMEWKQANALCDLMAAGAI